MSGGAFNYVCFTLLGGIDAVDDLRDLSAWLNSLVDSGGASDAERWAAGKLNIMVMHYDNLDKMVAELSRVMYAVEWHASGDWTRAQMAEVCEEWQGALS